MEVCRGGALQLAAQAWASMKRDGLSVGTTSDVGERCQSRASARLGQGVARCLWCSVPRCEAASRWARPQGLGDRGGWWRRRQARLAVTRKTPRRSHEGRRTAQFPRWIEQRATPLAAAGTGLTGLGSSVDISPWTLLTKLFPQHPCAAIQRLSPLCSH